ncbi:ABC transporter substrate-binding protein [Pseudonocardia acaciae]|uniref:ABC transporter substrate-binding protein n=1 Tax=Pseudonocardia acaciae TaxID=551276 RepID=UPI00048DC4D2|nr:ABC transporter substrate-binding protein [Pseudonocardia acaciae]
MRLAILAVLALALVGLGIPTWYGLTHCAGGLAKVDGQCIGITDGNQGPVFGDRTAAALRLIGEENARVAGDPSAVSIAYVVPIPPPGTDDDYAARVAEDVMGAAIAQRQANRTKTAGRPDRPPIRVLIANIGKAEQPANGPIGALREMATTGFAEHHLMAVVISGKSSGTPREAIDPLLAAHVPLIIAGLTDDQLTSAPVTANSSIARIAPTTSDEAAAAAAYLRSTGARKTLIVQNTDPRDAYSRDLGRAFREHYPGDGYEIVVPDEVYAGERSGAANTMNAIVTNLCQQQPDALFFAGRSPELAALVAALSHRPCLNRPIKVVTGHDGATFAAAAASGAPELRNGLSANVSVAYTALAHPESWRNAPGAFQPNAAEYLTCTGPDCFPTLFPGQSLDDGDTIMAYDAIMTAVRAIRSSDPPLGSPAELIQQFKRIHGVGLLPGASGWISLAPNGNAQNKAVPILGIGPDGRTQFVQLSSPSGTPCVPGMSGC